MRLQAGGKGLQAGGKRLQAAQGVAAAQGCRLATSTSRAISGGGPGTGLAFGVSFCFRGRALSQRGIYECGSFAFGFFSRSAAAGCGGCGGGGGRRYERGGRRRCLRS